MSGEPDGITDVPSSRGAYKRVIARLADRAEKDFLSNMTEAIDLY
jgi:hypothetical protein